MSTKKTVLAALVGASLLLSMPALAEDTTPVPDNTAIQNQENSGENDATDTPITQDNPTDEEKEENQAPTEPDNTNP